MKKKLIIITGKPTAPYYRFGTDYYKVDTWEKDSGFIYDVLIPWKREQIATDHGEKYFKSENIAKFDTFANAIHHSFYFDSIYCPSDWNCHNIGTVPKSFVDQLSRNFADKLSLGDLDELREWISDEERKYNPAFADKEEISENAAMYFDKWAPRPSKEAAAPISKSSHILTLYGIKEETPPFSWDLNVAAYEIVNDYLLEFNRLDATIRPLKFEAFSGSPSHKINVCIPPRILKRFVCGLEKISEPETVQSP